jgi:hypothetical protein
MRMASMLTSSAVSEQKSFAIPASTSVRSPESNFSAGALHEEPGRLDLGRHLRELELDRPWCFTIGTPNVSRSCA